MAVAVVSMTIPSSCHHHCRKLLLRYHRRRVSPSRLFSSIAGATRALPRNSMAASGAYTTIKEKVTFEREIKKSKFIAIAGPVTDDQSAHSFLSQVPMGVEISFDLLGVLYHQLQAFSVEDTKQDYDTVEDGSCMITFKVDFDKVEQLEEAIKENCSRDIIFYKR